MKRSFQAFVAAALALSFLGCGPKNAGGADTDKEASEHRKKALDALGKQDWDTAIRHGTEAVRLDPKVADAWWARAVAYLGKKEYAKAAEDCTEAIKLEADHAPAYRERGRANLGLQKYPAAIEDFTTYLKLRPNDPEGYEMRALAHAKAGKNAESSADLRAAEKLKGMKK